MERKKERGEKKIKKKEKREGTGERERTEEKLRKRREGKEKGKIYSHPEKKTSGQKSAAIQHRAAETPLLG